MSFEFSSLVATLKAVLTQNILAKVLVAIGAYTMGDIFIPHQKLFLVMFLVYILDFATGIWKAMAARSFSSARFFRGAIKLGVYCGLVVTAHAIDVAMLTGTVFTTLMFAFIITTESSSILENLHDLGFNTPAPLQRFLKSYSQKLWREKIAKIDPEIAKEFEDYAADFSELVNVYIPKISCPQLQKLLKIKFEHWGILCDRVQSMEVTGLEMFKAKFLLLVKETIKDIETAWKKAGIDEKIIEQFDEMHQPKKDRFFIAIDKLTDVAPDQQDFDVRKMAILKELSLLNYQALTEVLNASECPKDGLKK